MGTIKNWISIKSILSLIGIVISIIWLYLLTYSDAFFTPYFVMFLLGCATSVVALYKSNKQQTINNDTEKSKQHTVLVCLFSVAFTLCVTFANYAIWSAGSFSLLKLLILLLGGFFIWYNISDFTINNMDLLTIKSKEPKYKSVYAFIVPFCIFVLFNLVILFSAMYPGNASSDSTDEINQAINGIVSNHHPYFHMLLIRGCVFLGNLMFNSWQAGVAVYSVVSILFMSACFSMILYTLYQIKIPMVFYFISFIFMLLMPYHICYMTTMWKDVIFGGFVALFCVYIFRIIRCIGMQKINYVLLIVSGAGLIAFRSNGFVAFLILLVAAVVLLHKTNKKVLITLFVILVIGLFLRFPLMNILNVKQTGIAESFSIPAQQIALTYKEHNDFTDEQNEFLSKIMYIDDISKAYEPGNADPVKNMLHKKNSNYFSSHLGDFFLLYLSGFIKHPITYTKAWIDQTKGFWNSGYNASVCVLDRIYDNKFDIHKTCVRSFANKLVNTYFSLYVKEPFSLFRSIGFFTWIFMYLLFVAIVRKNKAAFLGLFLNLAVIATLMIATPEFAEFRYAYCLFCSVPFLAWTTFLPQPNSR